VTLRRRPAEHCGADRDARWRRYEFRDLGALGPAEICSRCPLAKGCYWPHQYGKSLEGASIVYATQARLERSSTFLAQLGRWVGAARVLTLVDECDLAGENFAEQISADELDRFVDVLRNLGRARTGMRQHHRDWLELTEMLRGASLVDLQDRGWKAPRIRPDWAAAVQRLGLDRYGVAFWLPAYRLAGLAASPIETRDKAGDGTIHFATRPYLCECEIFTATTDPAFARYRFGTQLASPFAGYGFRHPATRWYNIASPIGAQAYLHSHAPQILDLFASLAAVRAGGWKRGLLVAKKCLLLVGLSPIPILLFPDRS
jgi:hypothetical protein